MTSEYLEFLDKVSQVWTEQNNTEVARKFSLSRSNLPSLIFIHRLWSESFNKLDDDLEEMTLRYHSLLSRLDSFENQDFFQLQDKCSHLEKENQSLKEQIYQKTEQISDLTFELEDCQRNATFKKKGFFS